MFEKVLIPIDFSADTGIIMETAARLPGVREAFLIHVVDATHPSKTGWKHGPEIEGAKIQLEELAEKLQIAGIAARTRVETITSGDVPRTIMAAARREGAPLIAMGARGIGGLSDLLLGSVSSTMLRISDRPVLVVRPRPATCEPPAPVLAKVLVPTDFSASADAALSAVKALSGIGEIVLAHAVTGGKSEADVSDRVKDAKKRLVGIRDGLRVSGLQVSCHVHVGPDAAKEIVRAAEEVDATLIVISTHSRGWIEEMLIGSTTHAVANHATRPLLVIPARWKG